MHLKLDIFQNLAALLSLPIRSFPIQFFFFSTFREVFMTDNSKFVDFFYLWHLLHFHSLLFFEGLKFFFQKFDPIFWTYDFDKNHFSFFQNKILHYISKRTCLTRLWMNYWQNCCGQAKKICPERYSFCQWREKVSMSWFSLPDIKISLTFAVADIDPLFLRNLNCFD